MRVACCWSAVVLGLVAGCRPGAAAPASPDGQLVLEVGGDHPSLAAELQRAGVTPVVRAPAPVATPTEGGGDAGTHGAPQTPPSAPAAEPTATPPATPDPAPSEFLEVQLAHGQNLVGLAKQYLGNGTRYPEILADNGWTEKDAKKLKDGTVVRIRRSRLPPK